MSTSSTWRDRLAVHPAAAVFPTLSEDDLRDLADDIEAHGLQEGVALYRDPATGGEVILDGRNRLDALELLGQTPVGEDGRVAEAYVGPSPNGCDPVAYVISRNVHRRHLTKRQRADLIVAAVKAGEADRAKPARSVKRDAKGRVRGTTRDPVKAKVLEEAARAGIAERTARQALVEAEAERKRPWSRASSGKVNRSIRLGEVGDKLTAAAGRLRRFVERDLEGKPLVKTDQERAASYAATLETMAETLRLLAAGKVFEAW